MGLSNVVKINENMGQVIKVDFSKKNKPATVIGGSQLNSKKPSMPVSPLKSDEDIKRSIEYFLSRPERYRGQNIRDCAIFVVGLNVLKRAGDLLSLTWEYFLNEDLTFRTHLTVKEQKRKKVVTVAINNQVKEALTLYYKDLISNGKKVSLKDPVFPSRNKNKDGSLKSMTVDNLYKKMKALEEELELEYSLGTHSLRKSLPYAMLRENSNNAEIVEEISELLGHADVKTTRRYIGLTQEKKDDLLNGGGKGSMAEVMSSIDLH